MKSLLKERKDAYSIIVLVEQELRMKPLNNWHAIATKIGCQRITVRKAFETLKAVRSEGYRLYQAAYIKKLEAMTQEDEEDLWKRHGLDSTKVIK